MIYGVKLMFLGVSTKTRRTGNVACIMKMKDDYKI
jgi:hypothetical protein